MHIKEMISLTPQAVELIGEINAPNVKIHLDAYHMNIEEQGFAQAVKTAGSLLGYVHIGESHRGYLGTGTIDFPELFR
jgi:D-psicose/D-tagatose/L-ribulose 3-epimerase